MASSEASIVETLSRLAGMQLHAMLTTEEGSSSCSSLPLYHDSHMLFHGSRAEDLTQESSQTLLRRRHAESSPEGVWHDSQIVQAHISCCEQLAQL